MELDKAQIEKDRYERVRLGDIARAGKESEFWIEIIKPTIDSIYNELSSIDTIDVSSDKKASIEILGRLEALRRFKLLETLIDGCIEDANTIIKIQDKEKKNSESQIYKVE